MATIFRVDGALQPLAPEGEDGTLTLEQMHPAVGEQVEEAAVMDDEGLLEQEMATTYVVYVWQEALPEAHPQIPQKWVASHLSSSLL